ncbi:LamG-like jellyroll fold domain-containing protein [Modestobacter sp. SSW1-42]|uniref:LamG-like jellyroll fold domain-containing protein n=1 Tax=Modestobacter sp. SSW1-42 TaxID=596372 RepID=UPI003985CC39
MTASRSTAAPPARVGLRSTGAALVVSALARTVLGVLLLLVLVAVLPAVVGWRSTLVTSGSMAPQVQPGDVTVVRPVDTADLEPGQVLLVDAPGSPGSLLLHRLESVEEDGLRLRGDANPTADSALVDPASVHGVGTLRLPSLGLPALWASQQRWLPLSAVVVGLAAVTGLALLHRSPTADRARPVSGRRGRWACAGAAVLGVAVLLPGTATAAFSATTGNGPVSFRSAVYYSCASAAAGAGAAQYLDLQETSGTVARNRGSFSGDGSYVGGVTYNVPGPACHSAARAVRLDGTSGLVQSSVGVTLQAGTSFTTQLWFATTTARGGHLIGFGNGTNGATSSARDRMVYMTNSGQLRFGVYDGTPKTVLSPARYNDGSWHLLTATFEAGTGPGAGLRLFVDGALVAEDPAATAAQPGTGYFRAGYDDLAGWPDVPTSNWFAGSIAHMSVYATRLLRAEVADQYAAVG